MVRMPVLAALVAVASFVLLPTPAASAAEPVYGTGVVNATATLRDLSNKYGSARLDSGVVGTDVVKLTPTSSSTNLSEASVTLRHNNYSQVTSKVTEYVTRANSVGKHINSSAEVYTSQRQGADFQWIPIKVGPGSQGHKKGTWVKVTARLDYSSTIQQTGRNFVQVCLKDPQGEQQTLANGSVSRSGTVTVTRRFYARVGDTFYLAVYAKSTSSKPTTSDASALATSTVTLTVSTDMP